MRRVELRQSDRGAGLRWIEQPVLEGIEGTRADVRLIRYLDLAQECHHAPTGLQPGRRTGYQLLEALLVTLEDDVGGVEGERLSGVEITLVVVDDSPDLDGGALTAATSRSLQ